MPPLCYAGAMTGRRERKKAATRLALSEAAMRLFLERGFDGVTVREIAEAADVSTTTLMKHFPTKEALVFDRDDEIERDLTAAVTERAPGTSALDALRAYMRGRAARLVSDVRRGDPRAPTAKAVAARRTAFTKLVRTTPALSDYWQKMWTRHEQALARVLERDTGRPKGDAWCCAVAHLVLEAAALSERSDDPARMVEVTFDILEHGGARPPPKPRISSGRRSRARSSR